MIVMLVISSDWLIMALSLYGCLRDEVVHG